MAVAVDRNAAGGDDRSHLDGLHAAVSVAAERILAFSNDGLMAEFANVQDAFLFTLRMQGASAHAPRQAPFRVALTVGERRAGMVPTGGAASDLAARLVRLAPPCGIALPATLHDQLWQTVPVPASPIAPEDFDEPLAVVISAESCRAWFGDSEAARRAVPLQPRAIDPRALLAVVPFWPSGSGDNHASTAAADVIRSLGGVGTWIAIVRADAGAIHGPNDLRRVRRATGARYILHGNTETGRGRLRLRVELDEADSERVLWSDRFDHPLDHPDALRQDAAFHIARAVPPLLAQRELDRLTLAAPGTLTAHDRALQAFAACMHPERDSFIAAAGLLREAERQPPPHHTTQYARVWWHLMAISQGWSVDPAADVRAAATAAAGMDQRDPAAMALFGFMPSVLNRDHKRALAMLDRVIETAPCCALAFSLKALSLIGAGEARSAVAHAEQAETLPALGPERAWRDHVRAVAHYLAGEYDGAAQWARISTVHHSGLAENASLLAGTLAVLGHLDEAHQAAQQVLAINPGFRIETWRQRAMLPEESRDTLARRLRLAGLPA